MGNFPVFRGGSFWQNLGPERTSEPAAFAASKELIVIQPLIVLVIAALFLGPSPAPAGQAPPTLRKLKQAAVANPQDPEAHYALGLKYESLEQTKQAAEEYRKALSLKPDYDQALYSLGRLMGELGETDRALKIIKQAVKLKPNSVEAKTLLATVYNRQAIDLLRQGSLEDAREAIEAGIQAKGGDAVTEALRVNLGCLYIFQDKQDEAVRTFQEVVRQNPDAAEARYNLALLYYNQGDFQAASRQFFALKGIDRDLAGKLSDYRFRVKTDAYVKPPVKTMYTFKGSPLLTKGTVLPSYAR
jgi:tetratricopeptide (TPR) repeat protein